MRVRVSLPTWPGVTRKLAAGTETVTLVFDKGNTSRENLDWVERSLFHVIGSLVPTQHPHLLEVSVDQMHSREADGWRAWAPTAPGRMCSASSAWCW